MNDKKGIDPKDYDFSQNAVQRFFEKHPHLREQIDRYELLDDVHAEFSKAEELQKWQARRLAPCDFVCNLIKKSAKYAAFAAAVGHGSIEMQPLTDQQILESDQSTEQGEGRDIPDDGATATDVAADVDATTARRKLSLEKDAETQDGHKPVEPEPYKPKNKEEQELIDIFVNVDKILEDWFAKHKDEIDIDKFAQAITAGMDEVKASPLVGPQKLQKMFKGRFFGENGADMLQAKLYKLKNRLAQERGIMPAQKAVQKQSAKDLDLQR